MALVREHHALRAAVVGSLSPGDVPSVFACYRFATKLRTYGDLLAACLDRVTAALHAALPEMGQNVAIDGSDLPAYANGQRYLCKNGPERERYSASIHRASRWEGVLMGVVVLWGVEAGGACGVVS